MFCEDDNEDEIIKYVEEFKFVQSRPIPIREEGLDLKV